jgi:hypothetical protein
MSETVVGTVVKALGEPRNVPLSVLVGLTAADILTLSLPPIAEFIIHLANLAMSPCT